MERVVDLQPKKRSGGGVPDVTPQQREQCLALPREPRRAPELPSEALPSRVESLGVPSRCREDRRTSRRAEPVRDRLVRPGGPARRKSRLVAGPRALRLAGVREHRERDARREVHAPVRPPHACEREVAQCGVAESKVALSTQRGAAREAERLLRQPPLQRRERANSVELCARPRERRARVDLRRLATGRVGSRVALDELDHRLDERANERRGRRRSLGHRGELRGGARAARGWGEERLERERSSEREIARPPIARVRPQHARWPIVRVAVREVACGARPWLVAARPHRLARRERSVQLGPDRGSRVPHALAHDSTSTRRSGAPSFFLARASAREDLGHDAVRLNPRHVPHERRAVRVRRAAQGGDRVEHHAVWLARDAVPVGHVRAGQPYGLASP